MPSMLCKFYLVVLKLVLNNQYFFYLSIEVRNSSIVIAGPVQLVALRYIIGLNLAENSDICSFKNIALTSNRHSEIADNSCLVLNNLADINLLAKLIRRHYFGTDAINVNIDSSKPGHCSSHSVSQGS